MLDPRTNVNFVHVQLTSYFTPFTGTRHCLISIQKKEEYSMSHNVGCDGRRKYRQVHCFNVKANTFLYRTYCLNQNNATNYYELSFFSFGLVMKRCFIDNNLWTLISDPKNYTFHVVYVYYS